MGNICLSSFTQVYGSGVYKQATKIETGIFQLATKQVDLVSHGIVCILIVRYPVVIYLKELLRQMPLCPQQTVLVSWMEVLIW